MNGSLTRWPFSGRLHRYSVRADTHAHMLLCRARSYALHLPEKLEQKNAGNPLKEFTDLITEVRWAQFEPDVSNIGGFLEDGSCMRLLSWHHNPRAVEFVLWKSAEGLQTQTLTERIKVMTGFASSTAHNKSTHMLCPSTAATQHTSANSTSACDTEAGAMSQSFSSSTNVAAVSRNFVAIAEKKPCMIPSDSRAGERTRSTTGSQHRRP